MPAPHRAPPIADLWEEVQRCTRCPLYRDATQGVAGEGGTPAALMLVGEQPGDQEDRAGRPFVGPAGQILDKALTDAGVDRARVFVTNAVKHFKNEPRGKRRLHRRPNTHEIDRCRWWLDHEIAIVRPKVIVALGATAARSVLGRPVSVGRERDAIHILPDGTKLMITLHPSYVLRLRDAPARRAAYDQLVAALGQADAAADPARKATTRLVA